MNVDNAGAGGGRGQVPPKPPDIHVSFKEKVLGRATGDPQPVENLIKRGIMTLDNDNRLLPRFTMEEDDYQRDLDLHQANSNIQPTILLSTRINMQGTTMDDLDQHQGEFNIYPPSNSPIMRMKLKGTATATHAHTSSSPDLGCIGQKFTWVCPAGIRQRLSKRLDRALCDIPWRTMFPEGFVENLDRVASDHSPILLRLQGMLSMTSRLLLFQLRQPKLCLLYCK
ncbi:hypothetical protein RJT34_31676 [Clitoria ternatea]|uniref:Uncharacterized protein n=1 Tax=Clitoria ternatea TaxID=43366 RepID=A0AAN9EWA4_CLITE